MEDHNNNDHELDLLEQQIWSLYKELRDLDGAIGREIRLHSQGHQEAEKAIANLCELYERKCDIVSRMAEANLHLEQTKERMGRRSPTPDREADELHRDTADHLDWLNPVLRTGCFEVERRDEPEPEITR